MSGTWTPTPPLRGQVALVTGASSGIGQGVAIGLAEAGAKVVANYRSDADGAEATLDRIAELGGEAIKVQADVSGEGNVAALIHATLDRFGRLDVLVANAGMQQDAAFTEMSYGAWQKVLEVNLGGAFLCARAAVKQFRTQDLRANERARGKIVFMSSVHEVIPWAGRVNYAASKGGMKLLMQSLAQEVAQEGIRVNSVAPGAIATDINKDVWQDERQLNDLLKLVPYGRIGVPGDIAGPVVFLCSDHADYITGTTLFVDGGMLLYPGFVGNG